MRGERVAAGLIVRYAGRRSADELLRSLVDETRAVAGPAGDRRPAHRQRRPRPAGLACASAAPGRRGRPGSSAGSIGRLAAPSVGNKRPAAGPAPGPGDDGRRPGAARLEARSRRDRQEGQPAPRRPSSGRMSDVSITDALNQIWNSILEITTLFVIPDWGALIGLLPILILLGVVGPL